jgi:hypothetical protein
MQLASSASLSWPSIRGLHSVFQSLRHPIEDKPSHLPLADEEKPRTGMGWGTQVQRSMGEPTRSRFGLKAPGSAGYASNRTLDGLNFMKVETLCPAWSYNPWGLAPCLCLVRM